MNHKTAAAWSPACLLLAAGAAHADLTPYALSAAETVQHLSNVYRSPDAARQGDWISTTDFRASLDQPLGRDRLVGFADFNLNRYKSLKTSDSNGYSLGGTFEWSVPGDLSGTLAADTRRRQYFYGFDGEVLTANGPVASSTHNQETDDHLSAQLKLGGMARWSLFSGFDATRRHYSDPGFQANDQRQWTVSGGTSYSTSPDLSFGLTANYTRGEYPNFLVNGSADSFNLRTVNATTRWRASGNSSFNASVGYTSERTDVGAPRNFVNGALNWSWSPPSHFKVNLGLARDTNSDTSNGPNASANLSGRSLNDAGHLAVSYELTAKVSLVATGQYAQRKYGDSVIPATTGGAQAVAVSGSNRTTAVGLTVNYAPTRIANLSCGLTHESRTSDASLHIVAPGYTNMIYTCSAQVRFD
ncbi:MAG: hypothetical protein ABW032_03980 [Burkholderiaceae bacterium]